MLRPRPRPRPHSLLLNLPPARCHVSREAGAALGIAQGDEVAQIRLVEVEEEDVLDGALRYKVQGAGYMVQGGRAAESSGARKRTAVV